MHPARTAVLSICTASILGLVGWMVYTNIQQKKDTFPSGSPPVDVATMWIPQQIDLARMRPQAIRPIDPVRYGGTTSTVTLELFGDYSDAASKQMEMIIRRVAPTYQGKIRFVWRNQPRPDASDPAFSASVFALCAGLKGRYWDVHDALLSASSLSRTSLFEIQSNLKLDASYMTTCQTEKTNTDFLMSDITFSQYQGISSAPILFIGSRAFKGPLTDAILQTEIEKLLKN